MPLSRSRTRSRRDTTQTGRAPKEGPSSALITTRSLCKAFRTVDAQITAAHNIDLDINAGTIVALTGASGSGKSTLLHLIGALDAPDAGTITVDGTDVTALKGRHLADYRRSIGFVFQRFNLLPTLTVLDNVTVPMLPHRGKGADPRPRARDLLDRVGLGGREHTLATRLSGGQQQRVAIARALMCDPKILLADEPTGSLDSTTGEHIINLITGLRDDHHTTILIATHDPGIAKRCDHTIHITDGRIQSA